VPEISRRHRGQVAIALAVLLPLVVLYIHGRKLPYGPERRLTTWLERGLIELTAPTQDAADRLLGTVEEAWSHYIALVDLQNSNHALEEENQRLRGDSIRSRELDRENARLRALLEFKRARRDRQQIGAHVVGKDMSPHARVVRIRIDLGAGDAIEEGMPVEAAEGLVGRVAQVGAGYADVLLTIDSRSTVSVKVPEKGIVGFVEGTSTGAAYTARLRFLEAREPLAVGDILVTSGHDQVFPAGIEVGYVRSLERTQRGEYYELEVAPSVDFSTLEEVLVVTGLAVADAPPATAQRGPAAPDPTKPPTPPGADGPEPKTGPPPQKPPAGRP
jgi:rod shape-determining protein MreC